MQWYTYRNKRFLILKHWIHKLYPNPCSVIWVDFIFYLTNKKHPSSTCALSFCKPHLDHAAIYDALWQSSSLPLSLFSRPRSSVALHFPFRTLAEVRLPRVIETTWWIDQEFSIRFLFVTWGIPFDTGWLTESHKGVQRRVKQTVWTGIQAFYPQSDPILIETYSIKLLTGTSR